MVVLESLEVQLGAWHDFTSHFDGYGFRVRERVLVGVVVRVERDGITVLRTANLDRFTGVECLSRDDDSLGWLFTGNLHVNRSSRWGLLERDPFEMVTVGVRGYALLTEFVALTRDEDINLLVI